MLEKWLNRLRSLDKKGQTLFWLVGGVVVFSLVGLIVLTRGSLPSVSQAPSEAGPLDTAGLVADVLIKLGIVLFLIIISFRLFGKVRGQNFSEPNSYLSVLESVHLSPQQSLHLIRVSDQTLLIGATDQQVTKLSLVDLSPEAVEELQRTPGKGSSTNLFERVLQAQTRLGQDKGNK